MYDVIIIGAGPAGISASLYTKRANLSTLVIYHNESALQKATKIQNYYGFKDGITGEDLYKIGIEQAGNIGVDVKDEEVIKIEFMNNIYNVVTSSNKYSSKSVILATGSKKNKPKIKGIEKFEGKGISYCAVCDGFFYKGKNIAVLGNGNYAISETNELINLANQITILTDGKEPPEIRADNVKIDTRKVEAINGEDRVESVEFEDGGTLKTEGVFIAQGVAGSSDFAKKLGVFTKNDNIVVNSNMETNLKGLYAAGDCTGGLLQVSKAVYEGTKAGLQVIQYLRNIKN